MKILALESSTEACSVALSVDGSISERFEIAPRGHGERLLPWVAALLSEARLTPADLDAVAVGRGPGGFTSLRMGVAAAQGLALAHDLPVHPVSSLAALASNCTEGRVLALLDARMGEVYAGWYEVRAGQVVEVAAECVCAPEELPLVPGQWLACGPGFRTFRILLAERLRDSLSGISDETWPSAAAVARLAGATAPVTASDLQPVYLRDQVATARSPGPR